jgi:subtilisin family serine protease
MVTIIPTPAAYTITASNQRALNSLSVPDDAPDGFVLVGDVSRDFLNMQSQYGVRYLDEGTYPESFFGEGLRVIPDETGDHDWLIHFDDVIEFVARIRQYRWESGQVDEGTL